MSLIRLVLAFSSTCLELRVYIVAHMTFNVDVSKLQSCKIISFIVTSMDCQHLCDAVDSQRLGLRVLSCIQCLLLFVPETETYRCALFNVQHI